jgi:hypothetical protein
VRERDRVALGQDPGLGECVAQLAGTVARQPGQRGDAVQARIG